MDKGVTFVNNAISQLKSPPKAAVAAFNDLKESYYSYKKIVETEKTKRVAIEKRAEVELEKIRAQREILEQYLILSFRERAHNIQNFFDALDKGIETDNIQVITHAMSSIVEIAKSSPLAETRVAIQQLSDPNVKSIDW